MKFITILPWILVILGIAIGIKIGFLFASKSDPSYSNPPEGVACTQEALECSDGSYVGRSGPKCEFTACPGE